jgi:hypothetical protein
MFTATEVSQMCMGEIVKAILSALGHRGVGKQIEQENRGWLKKHTKEDGGEGKYWGHE